MKITSPEALGKSSSVSATKWLTRICRRGEVQWRDFLFFLWRTYSHRIFNRYHSTRGGTRMGGAAFLASGEIIGVGGWACWMWWRGQGWGLFSWTGSVIRSTARSCEGRWKEDIWPITTVSRPTVWKFRGPKTVYCIKAKACVRVFFLRAQNSAAAIE